MKNIFLYVVFFCSFEIILGDSKIDLCEVCKCSKIKNPDNKLSISCKFSYIDWERVDWPRNDEKIEIELGASGQNSGATMLPRFPYNEQIKFINITSSGIKSVKPGAFKNLPNLEYLSLTNNSIKYLGGNIFQGLKKLKSLDLSQNKLTEITSDVFEDLQNLEELYLGNNELTKVPIETLENLKELRTLDLSSNIIFILKTNELMLPKLKNLDLSKNNLTVIASETFSGLKSLENINLSNNKIVNIESKAFDISNLKSLDISYNRLSNVLTLPESIQVVNLEWNAYIFWPFEKPIEELRYLNLRQNNIRKVNLDESYKKLETLILSGNVLIEYPRMKLNELSTLDLSNNDFSILPEQLDINLMPNLRHLSLSGNPIRKIKFENILSLETLEINDMSRLTEISGLENIHGRIFVESNKPCVHLSISNCELLVKIQNDAFENINLCSLNLSHNALKEVPLSVPNDIELDLQGNPLICSCSLQWFLDDILPFLYKHHQHVLPELRCGSTRLVYWYNWPGKVLCDKDSKNYMKADLKDLSLASSTYHQT
ncbi:P-granule-associated novel protein 1-like, partial [Ctenocephalides felis]|uniref:P-granule-associated novel protein 1-like n=1 Tax=Ctenocephalides felis TaxID=7515 RepID=UPI000E6E1FF1